VLIVDAHAHVDEVPALGWMDPAASLITLMDQAGVDRAIVMTYTELPSVNPNALEYLAEQIAQYPERLIGYVRVHPWYPTVLDLLERAWRGSDSPGAPHGGDAILRLLAGDVEAAAARLAMLREAASSAHESPAPEASP